MIDDSAQLCVRNYQKAKYLPADFSAHVVAYATCVAGPAKSAEPSVLNPNDVTITPPLAPVSPAQPVSGPAEPVSPPAEGTPGVATPAGASPDGTPTRAIRSPTPEPCTILIVSKYTDMNKQGDVLCCAADWCTTTASKGGVWDIFDMVKAKLCASETGFDKPWGPVNLDEVVECPCGEVALYPDNECVPDATNSSAC